MNQRIEWIDSAKGLGIFLVVLGHALAREHVAATVIWTFHMPLFFFLSGLTARAWTPHAVGPFLRSLKNLAIPYVFFSGVSIVLWQTHVGHGGAVATWADLLAQAAYGVAGPEQKMAYNAALWFFTCLFSIRLLFGLITACFTSLRTLALVVVLLAFFAHTVVFAHYRSWIWNVDVALVGLLFHTAGYMIKQTFLVRSASAPVSTGPIGIVWLSCACIAVAAVALTNGRIDMNERLFGASFLFYAGAFAGIYAALALSRPLSRYGWIGTIGQASIVIFPLHLLCTLLPFRVMSIVRWGGLRLTHSELASAIIVSVVEILLCLPVYFALLRWAPQLIGLGRPKPAIRMTPPLEPRAGQ